MRFQVLIAAGALLLAACSLPAPGAAPAGAGVGRPPSERAIEVRLSCERDGEICGEAERVVWRRMDQRIELPGVLAGSALILDLRADFNLAGEFWGTATVSVPGAGGAPATLKRYELLPTTARNWDLRLEAAGVEHVLHLEMDYDFWMRSALERPRFLHRPKHLR